jgi:hypothetical protein
MKCIHCGTDSRLKDRSGGRCPKCKHAFAFEPTTDTHRVTDGQLKGAIDRVSFEGKVAFSARALWHEFNRKWTKPGFWRQPYGWFWTLGLAPVVAWAMQATSFPTIPVLAGGIAAGAGLGALLSAAANKSRPAQPRPPRISLEQFRSQYLARWRAAHGEIPLLLPPRETARLAAPRGVPADVAAFSFDRAVVTEHWDTAAMLVANRFHFEHSCAVLSRDGYPEGIAETVKEMLRRNPSLTVFVLHDASIGGCLLPAALRDEEWFPEASVRIVDVGLRPETVRKLRLPVLRGHPGKVPPRLAAMLTAEDAHWLEQGNVGELASLRPPQVMHALSRAIAASAALSSDGYSGSDTGGGGIIWFGDMGGSGGGDTSSTDGFG